MSDTPYDKGPEKHDPTPYLEKEPTTPTQWLKDHQTEVLAGLSFLLLLKNRKLKRRNYRLASALKEAEHWNGEARKQLETLSLFDQIFGRQPANKR